MTNITISRIPFVTWLLKVDSILLDNISLVSSDLPDHNWLDSWDNDRTPREAVIVWSEEMGYDFDISESEL